MSSKHQIALITNSSQNESFSSYNLVEMTNSNIKYHLNIARNSHLLQCIYIFHKRQQSKFLKKSLSTQLYSKHQFGGFYAVYFISANQTSFLHIKVFCIVIKLLTNLILISHKLPYKQHIIYNNHCGQNKTKKKD